MNPTVFDRPLTIQHGLTGTMEMSPEERKAGVTSLLTAAKEKGFGGVVSNVPFTHYLDDPEAFEIYRFAAEESERLGLRLWIYDEEGYPSGAADVKTLRADPDYECIGVVLITEELAAGETREILLPKGHEFFLSAAVYPGCGGVQGITDFAPVLRADCRGAASVTLTNPSETPAVACAFARKRLYEGTHCEHNVHTCRRYVDVTNPDAIREFLSNTYERYYQAVGDRFGKAPAGGDFPPVGGIEAIFTDEPSLMGCYINAGLYPPHVTDPCDDSIPLYPVVSWGRDLEKTYEERYGKSCLPDLVWLFAGSSPEAMEYRDRFYTVLSDLYENAYFRQIGEWCGAHGLNFSGHILLEDDIRHHVVFEGNYFNLLRHMHYPGIDMLNSLPEEILRQYVFTPKLISSIARANGRPHVMDEVSGHHQGGQITVPQQYASVCLQYALGVDIFTYYYGFNFMEPEKYAAHNTAHGRIHSFMSGSTVTDALLYYPIETFRRRHLGSDAQYGFYTPEENTCKDSLYGLMDALVEKQIDFDFTDYGYLSRCRAEKGELVTPQGDRYGLLLFPAMDVTPELSALLKRFEAEGVRIASLKNSLFPEMPSGGFDTPEQLIASLDRSRFAVGETGCSQGIVLLTRDTPEGRRYFFVNALPEEGKVSLLLNGADSLSLTDPLENRALPFEAEKTAQGLRISFTLPGYEARLLG